MTNNCIQHHAYMRHPHILHVVSKWSSLKHLHNRASGKLVTAGYILLKGPEHNPKALLHTISPKTGTQSYTLLRYCQIQNDPYGSDYPTFGSPMRRETHVTPVCKGLLSILTGTGSALFLLRYTFSTTSQDQIKRHFDVHLSWSCLLKPIPLSPRISHLDQQRIEYSDDGGIVKRSTREWDMPLAIADGISANCDVVNGGPDRQATVVCPQSYSAQAQTK